MNVDVVIVTFNRLEKLKKAITSYENQTKPFRNMIVVNNHSTDGTFEYLEEWKKQVAPFSKFVISTDENLGGSGGYYLGQKKAMELAADWVFLADDDAYANPDMMERFYDYVENTDSSKLSAICGTVYHADGTIDFNHRSRYVKKGRRFVYRKESKPKDYQKPEFEIDYLSYVGSFINGNALSEVGPVDSRFFIFWDDSEHSLRLKKYGKIICVPQIGIVHDDGKSGNSIEEKDKSLIVSWRDYYLERNGIVMYRRHFPSAALHLLRKEFFPRVKGNRHGNELDRVKWHAFKDAWLGKLGKHEVYKPGWEVRVSD